MRFIVSYHNVSSKGGGTKLAYLIAEILSKKYEVIFLAGNTWKKEYISKFYEIDIKDIKFINYKIKQYPCFNIVNRFQMKKAYKKINGKIDGFFEVGSIIHNTLLPIKDKIPVFLYYHPRAPGLVLKVKGRIIPTLYGNIYTILAKRVINKIDLISTNSKFTQKIFEAVWKIKPNILYPMVSDNFFDIKNEGKEGIVSLLRIIPSKFVERLIEVQKKINTNLTIIGSVNKENLYYLNKLKKLAKGRKIKFVINATHEEIKKEFKKAKIFLYPVEYECFGMALAEAQASGLPTITFGKGGPEEIVINGKTGFVIKDVNEMISKTKYLLNNKKIRLQMSKKAKMMAKKRFGRKAFEKQIFNIAKKLGEIKK